MKFKAILINHLVLFGIFTAKGQSSAINPALLKGAWSAGWITHPTAMQREYGVYHFRKTFTLPIVPATFLIHVSADNRYRLFVNGIPVNSGPARGDLFNWYYESLDIAAYLKPGENTIAAMVWNMGTLAPVAQVSNQTAFLVQGNTSAEEIVNTNTGWKVLQNKAYTPCSLDNGERLKAYMVIGPGDQVDGSQYPWGWEYPGYNDASWENAMEITHPEPVGYGTDNRWTLAPRNIPLFEEHLSRFPVVRRSSGIKVEPEFLTGKKTLKIPAHQTVSILLDAINNTVAYPQLLVTKGKGSSIKMTYAEALFDKQGNKGNRNDIENKEIKGNYDIFLPDGGETRKFRPLWFRGYRYLQLDITTADEPLLVNDIYSMKTGYPLQLNATFTSNDRELQEIWKVGWHTAELCAGELYYDCPYYEQLQYTGDSRIQALISLYGSGDDRLMRKAILDFYHSRTPEGLTQGRYPSNRLQIIPTFSLFWISMVYDYWMHRQDDAFVKQFLPAINEILEWYKTRVDQRKKMLGPLTWWNFVDWDNFNDWGTAPGADTGGSSIITLQYAYTLNQAADLYRAFDHAGQTVDCKLLARELNDHTFAACYNAEKGLLADTPEQRTYSQHASIWAVLSGAVPLPEAQRLMKNLLKDKSIGQVTFFYRFYLIQALKKAEMADLYYSELQPWREMLKLGLTTFAEKPEPTRSDCHAWSASPNYDFLATICGIMPETPGFRTVLIKPALGELTEAAATFPHPTGKITVKFIRQGKDGIHAEITLPESLTGTFIWQDRIIKIHGGKQAITINQPKQTNS
ncbi:family 78 glycoside hydrolase catalytic domain [Pedobacter sp. L105]|uniref:family 78 glycoside hydrolase catalytic domain n=1 Tax=Pedobacter sp. L105 TaxID=1641871 RepID=UPI00131DD7E7|nr:family 78 glycoside hydrolase catalytic domain [Pedobacter sp. L105]